MAMYDVKFKSFKHVEAHWESIKPIRGRKEDVRPIADRARTFERISKLSDTCYSLNITDWGDRREDIITWELVSGYEVVTIKNGVGQWAHTSIYSFLDRFLPQNVGFVGKSGKQFIEIPNRDVKPFEWVERYLPKRTDLKDERGIQITRPSPLHDWIWVGDEHIIPLPRVDKEAKKAHKEVINNFCEWMWNMLPLLEDNTPTNWQERRDKCVILGISAPHHSYWQDLKTQKAAQTNFLKLLHTPDDPLYVDLAIECIAQLQDNGQRTYDREIHAWVEHKLSDDAKAFRRKVNTWVNKHGGFTTITTDY
tara:strand:- start:2070 stop:2993 length:924 start_codon:yes stop_codon:yes gene_type:complete